MVDQDDPGTARARLRGAVHACGPCTDDRHIKGVQALDHSRHIADAPDGIDIDARAALATAST